MADTVLDGIRVADFTRGLSGPAATQILGDLGADVIKIEGFDGDEQRSDRGASKVGHIPSGFIAYNRNKRSIVLNLKSDGGLEAARRLVQSADIVVENFRTGVMERFGLDYETVSATNPALVYCSITGFGSKGPLAKKAANDIAIQARSGMMSITGYPNQEPVRAHGYPADLTTGIYGALGILGALQYRNRTGKGQRVEVSMMGSTMSLLSRIFGEYLIDGYVPPPLGSGSDMGTPNGAFPTSDGWITISAVPKARWERCCKALGITELIDDPRFQDRADRRANRDVLNALIGEATSKMTKREAEERLEANAVSCSPIYTIAEAAAEPAFADNFLQVPLSDGSMAPNVRLPISFSQSPASIHQPVPEIGEDGRDVLTELGFSPAEIDEILPQVTELAVE